MRYLQQLENTLFYLALFCIPFQFGLHFWPPFSFVHGLRVDYLSPTLFVSDIIILGLFIIFVIKAFSVKKPPVNLSTETILLFLAFFGCLIGGALIAHSLPVALLGIIKLLECAFFAYYAAHAQINMRRAGFIFAATLTLEAIIAMLQFYNQSSVGGLLYFLGERTFSSETPGIANASLGGHLVLRPYATLPHPNVLAGFLLISLLLMVYFLKAHRDTISNFIKASAFLFAAIGIVLTLSRSVWILSVISGVFFLGKAASKKHFMWLFFLLVSFLFLWGPFITSRFSTLSLADESVKERKELAIAALRMYHDNPLFGVGMHNYLVKLPEYYQEKTIYMIQPVHNIFLLVLSELGIFAFSLVLLFLVNTARVISQKTPQSQQYFYLIGLVMLGIGMVDHYLLTLQQGQLLLSLYLGLVWNKTTL